MAILCSAFGPLAQLAEQVTLNYWVLGSSPRWVIHLKVAVGEKACDGLISSAVFFCAQLTAWAGDYLIDAALPSAADYKLRGLLGAESLEEDEA